MPLKTSRRAAYKPALLVALVCMVTSHANAAGSRAAWMWSKPSHNYGAANIIGNLQREEDVLTKLDAWSIDHAYVSYGTLTLSNSEAVAHWNKSLSNDGVMSQLLLGENTWIYPQNRTSLLAIVQGRLVNFNLTRNDPAERINGLHLDIEPQGLNAWKFGTSAERKEMLYLLSDAYAEVRQHLDNNNAEEIPIYADLPVWLDSSASIGWNDSSERDAWFANIAQSLDGISLMAFERSTLSSIVSGVDWEVQNLPLEVRIGLNAAEIGPGKTFADFEAFDAMANGLESHYGNSIGGIDYQPFYTYTDVSPAPELSADFDSDGDVDGADFLAWQKGYGTVNDALLGDGDSNANGKVNRYDLSAWEAQFAATTITTINTPEPNSVSLFLIAAICYRTFPSRGKSRTRP